VDRVVEHLQGRGLLEAPPMSWARNGARQMDGRRERAD